VEQTFALDVEFAPATGLSWRIPEALISADLEASIGDERLPTQIDRARRVLTVGLTPPRIGRFEILARYAVELPESGDAKWQETRSIPLLQLETAPVALTRVEIFDSTGLPLARPERTSGDCPHRARLAEEHCGGGRFTADPRPVPGIGRGVGTAL
jgi:hypothetical protein